MAGTTDIVITDPCVRGLRCPFTGRDLEIVGHIGGGHVTYNAPGAFSLAEPQESIGRLYARASMRNGVEGVLTREESMVDPYTGRRLSLVAHPDGRFSFRGGFDPRRGCLSLADFVKAASCGRRDIGAPPAATSVPHALEDVPRQDDAGSPHEAVEEMSEKAAHDIAKAARLDKGRTTVSMSTGKAKGRR